MILFVSVSSYAAETEQDLNFCLAKDKDLSTSQHKELMKDYGVTCATIYYNLLSKQNLSDPFGRVRSDYLEKGYSVILTLIFSESKGKEGASSVGLAKKIVNGDFDKDLLTLIAAIKKANQQLVIRPLHELNGNWRPWQMYSKGNSPLQSALALKHIADMFHSADAPVSIEVNFNRRGGKGKVLGDAEIFMPMLNEVVDAFSISNYNRCGLNPNYAKDRSFASEFRPMYERIREFSDKPINVAETSTSGLCEQSRISWFKDMLSGIENEFPQVKDITFFFGQLKPGESGSEVNVDWGFDTVEKRLEFRKILTATESAEAVQIETVDFDYDFDYRMPWNIYGNLSHLIYERNNPALNPVTRESFGKSEIVFRGAFTQKVLFDVGNGYEFGPSVSIGTVQSSNDNMWWNNQKFGEVSLGLYRDFDEEVIIWGGWTAEIYAQRRRYDTDVPADRYVGSSENRVGFRIKINTGGDWAH
jgi:hypothetical protein